VIYFIAGFLDDKPFMDKKAKAPCRTNFDFYCYKWENNNLGYENL